MNSIVLATELGFLVVPDQFSFYTADASGKHQAHVRLPSGGEGSFGPRFATEAEARALCRAAAVALAEGTGGVFGEAEPEQPLKAGDRVTFAVRGSSFGVGGTVTSVDGGGFRVKWDDEDVDECTYEWADAGVYVAKAAGPAEMPKPPVGPVVGMRVRGIGRAGAVVAVKGDGRFSVHWDGGRDPISIHSAGEFGTLLVAEDGDESAPATETKSGPKLPGGPVVGMRVRHAVTERVGEVVRANIAGWFRVHWGGRFGSNNHRIEEFGVDVVPLS